jgi:hypothetical protein
VADDAGREGAMLSQLFKVIWFSAAASFTLVSIGGGIL